ncbi:MAG: hypothetical protein ABFC89_08995 [Methanospirillum sp.]
MAEDCERPDRVVVEIGGLPGRLPFDRAGGRVYRAPRPFRFVGMLPDVCEPGFDYVVVDVFPVEIDALRVYFAPDGLFPDLVQAFNPPLVLAEGDVLEPTIPAELPAACPSSPGPG